VPQLLKKFLQNNTIRFCRAAIHNDVHMLRYYGINIFTHALAASPFGSIRWLWVWLATKITGCRTRSLGVCDHELVLYGEI
jgi:hypothetical protein